MIKFLKKLFTFQSVTDENIKKDNFEFDEVQFYQDIEDNFEYIQFYLDRFSKYIGIFKLLYEQYEINIYYDDLADIFCEIYHIVKECRTIDEFNQVMDEKEVKRLFLKYVYKISKNELYDIVLINKIANIRCNEAKYIEGYVSDILLNTYEEIEKCIELLHNIDFNMIKIEAILCLELIRCIIAINKIICMSRYIPFILKNNELLNILKDNSVDIKDLYNIYIEFYSDNIDEMVSLDDCYIKTTEKIVSLDEFKNLIEIVREYRECSIENIRNMLEVLDLDIDKFIKECKDETIYRDYNKIISTKGFELLMQQNVVEIVFTSMVPYFSIKKMSIKKWLITLFEQEDFLHKVNIYREKYKILSKSHTPNIQTIKDKYNSVETGVEFELFLKELYEHLGYEVSLTPATGDQGADLIIEKNHTKTVIQAKFYTSTVGNSAVQEVIGAIGFYKADKGMVITNNVFTKSAKELAKANNIHLIDGDSLVSIIETVM